MTASTRLACTVLVSSLLVGIVLRVWAAVGTDFWFDEIWSQEFGVSMSIAEIFGFKHDNNHVLNTVWCNLVGNTGDWIWYRLPALIGGILTLPLVVLLVGRQNLAACVFTGVLVAVSYPLVHYASEARGYGPMVALAVAGVLLVRRYLEKQSWVCATLYWLCVAAGLLFQLTFVFAAVASGVWTLWQLRGSGSSWRTTALSTARLHAVPAGMVVALYFGFVRGWEIGGGPAYGAWRVLNELAVTTFAGSPGSFSFDVCVAALVVGVLSAECVFRWRNREPMRVFYTALLVLTPLLTFGVLKTNAKDPLFMRYFLVLVPFLVALAGSFLGRCWSWGLAGRVAAVVVASLAVVANGSQLRNLLGDGKGQYLAAVRYMTENSESDLHVAFDEDTINLNGKLLAWYARFLPEGRKMIFHFTGPEERTELWSFVMSKANGVSLKAGPTGGATDGGMGAEWWIRHSWEPGFTPKPQHRLLSGKLFDFDRKFGSASISGWSWYVYRARP